MYIQHPLGNNGIKLLTCKGSSFNSSSIFFAKQCHVDISFHVILIFKVLRVLTNILLNSYKLFYNPFFQAIFEREWLKELRNCILCIIFVQSLFCLIRVNVGLRENYIYIFYKKISKRDIQFQKYQFKILVLFSPIFVADTKIIFPYDFVAPLKVQFE